MNYSLRKAFTLAEVLITLAIIGIVAAITIPTLVSEYKDRVYLAALKKMYANLQNAQTMINAEYGLPSTWSLVSYSGAQNNNENTTIAEYYAEAFGSGTKFCGFTGVHPLTSGCINGSDDSYYTLNGQLAKNNNWYNGNGIYHYTYQYLLKDGSTVAILFQKNYGGGYFWGLINNKIIALFIVDVNGNAKPNRVGKDIYFLMLKDNKLSPSPYSKNLETSSVDVSDQTECSKLGLGFSCAYFIMKNGWNFPKNY